jgi:hypothetical protein
MFPEEKLLGSRGSLHAGRASKSHTEILWLTSLSFAAHEVAGKSFSVSN